jgi:hypothetical protein
MGIDVHAFVEYRDPQFGYVSLSEGELWLPYRQHGLFAALVDLFPPRRLPADCGRVVRGGPYVQPSLPREALRLSTPDEFNPSWLTAAEILRALEHYGV